MCYYLSMKNDTQKGYIVPILLVIIVILLSLVSYLVFINRPSVPNINSEPNTQTVINAPVQNAQILSSTEASTLVVNTWGGCTPDSCSRVVVTTEQINNQTYVTAIYEGLRDDSVSAQRKTALATYENGKWSLGTPLITYRCQVNRGHQDFTAELCL